jgi:hypothetical protein
VWLDTHELQAKCWCVSQDFPWNPVQHYRRSDDCRISHCSRRGHRAWIHARSSSARHRVARPMRTGLGILPAVSQRRQARVDVLHSAAASGARSNNGETHPPVVSEVSICSPASSMAAKHLPISFLLRSRPSCPLFFPHRTMLLCASRDRRRHTARTPPGFPGWQSFRKNLATIFHQGLDFDWPGEVTVVSMARGWTPCRCTRTSKESNDVTLVGDCQCR